MKKKWIRNAIYYGMKTKTWKIMRLSAFFLFLFLSQVWAESGYSQQTKLTLKMDNARVIDVLDEIENNSEFYFLFNQKLVDVERKVDVNAKEKTIDKILTDLFVETDVRHQVKDRLIILTTEKTDFSSELVAQQKTISGTITDKSGQPLPGVTVIIKGTTQGTVTNTDGNYSISNIPENVTLVFSFIGMVTQELIVGDQTTINVTMAIDAIGIEEVVAIGYGTQKKSNLTSAVEMVDTKMLNNRPVRTVGEMLEGVVPNLNISVSSGAPDANPSFNIRGFTGFGSSAAPLILVDGAEQNINSINANDIESISVLKDAAASAIYGSRAPNGVILIITKMGKKGSPMRINYSTNLDVNEPTYLPHSMNSVSFSENLNMAFNNDRKAGVYSQETIDKMQAFIDGTGPSNSLNANGQWEAHFGAHGNTDAWGLAFKDNSVNLSHNLNLSGGSDKTSYYMGLGYNTKEGIMNTDFDEYDRMSAVLKINSDVNDWISVGMNTRYSKTNTLRPNYRAGASGTSASYSDALFIRQLSYFTNVPAKNPDGSYHWLSPLPAMDGLQGTLKNQDNDLWIIPSIQIRPLKGLTLNSSFSYNARSHESFETTFEVMVDRGDGVYRRSGRTAAYDGIEQIVSKTEYYQFESNAEYKFTKGNHDFLFLTGFQQEYSKYNNLFASRRDLYNTDIPTFSTAFGDQMNIDDRIFDWATRGFYFRGSYNYKSIYLLDINARYDASSKFAPDSRWAFFPSVSVGYNIAREEFWNVEQINMLKVTGTWGKSGNHGTGISNGDLYTYLPTLGTGKNNIVLGGDFQPYVSLPPIVSADLTWAKPRTIGFGLEAGMFNNRLQGEYRWYQRTVFDQVSPPVLLPEVLGAAVPKTNNGVSETRGWEVSLSWRDKAFNIAGSPVNYGIRAMLSDYIGYVVDYGELNESGLRNGTWTPGEVFGIIYGYNSAGIAPDADFLANNVAAGNGWYYPGDQYYKDIDGDGRIGSGDGSVWYTEGDRQNLGYNYPRYKYGVIMNASWKNFNLDIFLDGVGQEKKWVNSAVLTGMRSASWPSRTDISLNEDLGGYWAMDNTDAFYPRIYTNGKNSNRVNDQYLLDLSHLRIKNINLSYSIPSNLVNKIKLNNASINLSIENLGMIYYNSYFKLDPTQLRKNGETYPLQRVYSLGLKIGI
ncbi:MAG: SusC/RagA family TonB-linked outer membrane protein [Draconibacterium sp.]|nr:SusC/RagA family TonB-linked outer membrane protein [Draconibacterium sp.]